ncbi:diacylglycerol kinase family protein [Halalkalibacter nanhaiisediminis]|uniref:Undecaprenol kinase n=1 Tax=Halalkalibacter nanhaiisediminis TaxID=688079 RepID=A0A562QLZ1_9BACI|nr:diacylglycerol kinase family protein [Halalkalibacter nanhaiisediminis]TWI57749.1 undecaprenol kinase [Halalkalibacter nanhaiisediminis]
MALQDRNRKGFKRLLRSFGYASCGLRHVIRHEQNMQIHIGAALIILISAGLLQLPLVQWLILLLVIAGMFALEIMNTAIERTVDLVTEEFHPLAKRAKDIAAAAVFVYSFFAVIIGLILFVPPLLRLIL